MTTTGSLVYGVIDGVGKGFDAISRDITVVNGTPDGVMQVNVGSQIALDKTNAVYYMGLTGSTWITLGSKSA